MGLVEREAALEVLASYAEEASGGSGRVALIAGEVGVGKTSLVEALETRTPRARWLWGRCDGLFTPRPLGPLFDIAAQTNGELADAVAADADRERLFAAFLRECVGLPEAPTIVVVEDVHWADDATLDLLRHLARRITRSHVMLIATFRDDELGDGHPLRVFLGELATLRSIRRMTVPPLTPGGVRILVGEVAEAERVYDLTGGNPFFVREVLAAGLAPGVVPTTVRDAVLARTTTLSGAAREVLEAAAVIGTRVEPDLLEEVAGPVKGALDACLAAGLLRSDADALRFPHELTRLAVGSAIPAHRRIELHARTLEALDARDEHDHVRLAFHADSAGNAEAVLRHAPEAALEAASLRSHRGAAAQYERALRYADTLPDSEHANLLERFAAEAFLVERLDDALASMRSALAIRERARDDLRAGDDLRWLGELMTRAGRGKDAAEALDRAMAILEQLPPSPELATLYVSRAVEREVKGQRAQALDACDKAISLAQDLDLRDVLVGAHDLKGWHLCFEGDDAGWTMLEQALETAIDEGLHDAAASVFVDLYTLGVELHRPERVERYFVEGVAHCAEHDLPLWGFCFAGARTRSMLDAARFDEAIAHADALLRDPRACAWNRVAPTIVRGAALGRRGDAGAWSTLEEGLATAEAAAEPQMIALARRFRAEHRWFEGRLDEVTAEIEPVFDFARREPIAWLAGDLGIWLHRAGALDTAPPGVEEPFVREFEGDLNGSAESWIALGCPFEAALVRSRSSDEATLRAALAGFRAVGARPAAAWTERRLRAMGVRGLPRGPRPSTGSAPHGLTLREQEVLACIVDGMTNAEIADRLFISAKTVDHHVSSILSKMGVHSRGAAARDGLKLGLTRSP